MLALIFSLVFVSVKLSGEHGNHLSAFPGGEALLADGFSPESYNSHRVTFWLPDPSAWDPPGLLSSHAEESEWH